ncbi:hypothetical protein KCP73_05495 [Salmonella enterica subsp. enterica]|nr:hypothetical protein KCP73_05495 [Salmonella enterica subsp. enterica]
MTIANRSSWRMCGRRFLPLLFRTDRHRSERVCRFQKGHAEQSRRGSTKREFPAEGQIRWLSPTTNWKSAIDIISKAAYTGKIGDGKIFVAELMRVIRIVPAKR